MKMVIFSTVINAVVSPTFRCFRQLKTGKGNFCSLEMEVATMGSICFFLCCRYVSIVCLLLNSATVRGNSYAFYRIIHRCKLRWAVLPALKIDLFVTAL